MFLTVDEDSPWDTFFLDDIEEWGGKVTAVKKLSPALKKRLEDLYSEVVQALHYEESAEDFSTTTMKHRGGGDLHRLHYQDKGYLDYQEEDGLYFLIKVTVLPEHRRQGIATKLLRKFLDMVRENEGAVDISGYTEMGEKYLKHVVTRLKDEYSDLVWMDEGVDKAIEFLLDEAVPEDEPLVFPDHPDAKYWNLTTTDMPFYDDLMRLPTYFKDHKGFEAKMEWLSPVSYLKRCKEMFDCTWANLEQGVSEKRVDEYAKMMQKGTKFPVLTLEPSRGYQEGRHRALAALKAGIRRVPVLTVMEPGRKESVEEEGEFPAGDCYRNVYLKAKQLDDEHPGLKIAHGKIYTIKGDKMIDHAWIELDDKVVDPTAGVEMDKEKWYGLVNAELHSHYSYEEVMVNTLRNRHWGPWEEK